MVEKLKAKREMYEKQVDYHYNEMSKAAAKLGVIEDLIADAEEELKAPAETVTEERYADGVFVDREETEV